MPYKLSQTLKAHTLDVRALSTPSDQLILSASRDTTAISWQKSSPDAHFTAEVVLHAGSRYINSIAYILPNANSPKGYAVTGGQDAVINIFNLSSPKGDPDYCLLGHHDNICALDVTGGTIISGSWDKTAKVWKDFNLTYDLKGHQQSVWAVLGINDDQFLTGSADKTVKLWQQHKLIMTFHGHKDAVRGLALIPDIGFASCSNDSEVRVWTYGGDLVYVLSGHTSFVYSLSVLPSGNIVSAGEDRTVRIWKDGECSQTVVHPAISVWAVSTMPNGDIVSGCSDGIVRIFSESEDRWASSEALKDYDNLIASQALPSQQVGDLKKEDLPGPEALNTPGKKSGEIKMIKNGTLIEAHQWDSTSSSWQKVGDVVDAVGSNRKHLYDGKEYDYVFDVDIQDGVPPLKLPYNVSENPYGAAQRFLQSNELPLSYTDEVVKFIEKNTAGVNLDTSGEGYVDPFTGASRYRASASAQAQRPTQAQYVDPFTGASRYVASPQESSPPTTSIADPFTGASRYSGHPAPSPAVSAAATSSKILPVPKLVVFKQANVSAMQSKIFQFNDALRIEISTASLAMYPEEIKTIEETFGFLAQVTSTPSKVPEVKLTQAHVEVIMSILDRWPASQRFPVIDLGRLIVGFSPNVFSSSPDLNGRFSDALFKAAEWNGPWDPPIPKVRETNTLLLLRSLANLFAEEDEAILDPTWLNKILETLGLAPYSALNKNHRVALATILFNLSCQGLKSPLDTSVRSLAVSQINKVLEHEMVDSEAVYRVLVALGNITMAANTTQTPLSSAQIAEIKTSLQDLTRRFSEPRVMNICVEVKGLI